MGKSLEIASLTKARRIKRRGFSGVIAIEDPTAPRRHLLRFHRDPRPDHLILRFEDLDRPIGSVPTPTSADVESALEFARGHPDALLVHCFAGVSRSTAIGLSILADRCGAGREQEALAALLAIVPHAVPNLLVIALADELLGREGRLLDVVQAWDAALPTNLRRRKLNEDAVLSACAPDAKYPLFHDEA